MDQGEVALALVNDFVKGSLSTQAEKNIVQSEWWLSKQISYIVMIDSVFYTNDGAPERERKEVFQRGGGTGILRSHHIHYIG